MLDMALVLRLRSSEARLEREGETEEAPPDRRREVVVGGRWETQSCTRSETWGFVRRLAIFLEAGLVVITMTGSEGEYGEEGR
jgi:hypothetical protein